jgi:hypothetical protein
MNSKTKTLLVKALVYMVLGFGAAFLWHKLKN